MNKYELPEGYTDAVYFDGDIAFGWRDRLKIMFGYCLNVRIRTLTEHSPGQVETDEKSLRLFNPRRKPMMEMATTIMEIPDEPAN